MSTELATTTPDAEIIQKVLLEGDLRKLTATQKLSYYRRVCESVGLNPITGPFAYIVLNNREVLYAKREATDQLRRLHAVSIEIVSREIVAECYLVTARATLQNGRRDENIGVTAIAGLRGEALANAMMKAETKAKRRVTLSIVGLGVLDESEVEGLDPQASPATPLTPTGETLRQALRDRAPAAAPAVRPLEEVLPPPVAPPAPQAVTILGIDPPPARSKALGYLRHSGDKEPIAYYHENIATAAREAQAAGVAVVLEIALTKETKQPYVKAITEQLPF